MAGGIERVSALSQEIQTDGETRKKKVICYAAATVGSRDEHEIAKLSSAFNNHQFSRAEKSTQIFFEVEIK